MNRDERLAKESFIWLFRSIEKPNRWPVGVWSTKQAAENWAATSGASGELGAFVLDECAMQTFVRLAFVPASHELATNPVEVRTFGAPAQNAFCGERKGAESPASKEHKPYASVEFTREELGMINNALNETANGTHIEDYEFYARTGCQRDQMRSLLSRIHLLL